MRSGWTRAAAAARVGCCRALVGLAVALLASCGGSDGGGAPDDDTVVPPVVAPGTWVVLGSSTAAGTGAASGQGWVDLLGGAEQPRGVNLTNLARSGLLTTQALPAGTSLSPDRAAPDPSVNIDRALTLSPKLVLLSFPTNDGVAGVPASETVAHWQAIARRAASAGAATLVLSTQPRDGLDGTQRAALDETDRLASKAFGPCFVPLRAVLSDGQGHIAAALSAGDGIHLNAQGHRVVYEQVMAALSAGRCVRAAA